MAINFNVFYEEIEVSDIKDENLRKLIEHIRLINELFEGINENIDYAFYPSKDETPCVGLAHLLSAKCSIESFENCVLNYHFSDAGTILRKLRDDLLQFLFLYKHVKTIGNEAILSGFASGRDVLTEALEKKEREYVEAWLKNGSTEDFMETLKNEFDCDKYKILLCKDAKIKAMIKKCFGNKFNDTWYSFNRRLNNMVHTNGRKYILMNTGDKSCSKENEQCITELLEILDFVSVVFFSFLMMINSSVIRSSDYVEYLELGMQPQENAQYWIMPVAQEFFDKILKPYNKELAKYVSLHNVSGMEIKNCD